MGDITAKLVAQVQQAFADKLPLRIVGGNSKSALGRQLHGEPLLTREHTGIVDYQPTELVITARAGTPLAEIEAALAEHGQMLAFEPPYLGESATLGGTIACGLSGPRRPFSGAARDFVLGVKMINGRGEHLQFGGQVMKNVAGYDISRLQVGAQGSLGVLLEISLKVLPRATSECTLMVEMDAPAAIETMTHFSAGSLPLSAACHLPGDANQSGQLWLRLSASPGTLSAARAEIQTELAAFALTEMEDAAQGRGFWRDVRERRLDFFSGADPLWRLSLPLATADFCSTDTQDLATDPESRQDQNSAGGSGLGFTLHRQAAAGCPPPLANEVSLPGQCLLDWAGAQRWLKTDASSEAVRACVQQMGGHAALYGAEGAQLAPLSAGLEALHRQIKAAFDPAGIINPGRLFEGL